MTVVVVPAVARSVGVVRALPPDAAAVPLDLDDPPVAGAGVEVLAGDGAPDQQEAVVGADPVGEVVSEGVDAVPVVHAAPPRDAVRPDPGEPAEAAVGAERVPPADQQEPAVAVSDGQLDAAVVLAAVGVF